MSYNELKEVMDFAEDHNLMDKSFLEVYDLYLKDMEDTFLDIMADNSLMSSDIQ